MGEDPKMRSSFEETQTNVEGDALHVWSMRPDGAGPHPTVVMAHGFAGVVDERLMAFAERFAAADFAAILFDYRTFGRSGGEPRQWMDIPRQQQDWRAAIAWAKRREWVDADRLALWGTSFSGGHVMDLAAQDGRDGDLGIAAAIAQAPFADGRQNAGDPKQAARLFGAALRDRARQLRGRDPYYIGAVGHPGDLAAMTTPDAIPDDWWQRGGATLWQNRITPRVFLQVLKWRPGAGTTDVRCPLLVQVAAADAVTPPQPARDAAANAPRGTAIEYDIEHFEIYYGAPFERAVTDQTAFLREHLRDGEADEGKRT